MIEKDDFFICTLKFRRKVYGFDTLYHIDDIMTLFTNERKVSC